MKAILFLMALVSAAAQAAEVIAVSSRRNSVAVSHDNGSKWVVGDGACIVQNDTDVVCGQILKATAKGAIVKLDTAFDGLSIGDRVRKSASSRRPAAETVETFGTNFSPRNFDLTLGVGAGLSFFYPMLHFQYALSKTIAIGLLPFYYSAGGGTTNISAIGGMATFNYYNGQYFKGLWVCAGAGMSSISVADTTLISNESASALTGILTVGYRFRWSQGLNLGVSAGIQYLAEPNFTTVVLKSSGIQPIANLDFGISF